MTVTIITLYRGESCETYVSVVEGTLTWEQEKEIAERCELATEQGEALDTLGFATYEVIAPPSEPQVPFPPFSLLNAFPEPYHTWSGNEEAVQW